MTRDERVGEEDGSQGSKARFCAEGLDMTWWAPSHVTVSGE